MNVAKRRAAGALVGKAAARFVPGLGLLLTAYELYQWFNRYPQMPQGWELRWKNCTDRHAGAFGWVGWSAHACGHPHSTAEINGHWHPLTFKPVLVDPLPASFRYAHFYHTDTINGATRMMEHSGWVLPGVGNVPAAQRISQSHRPTPSAGKVHVHPGGEPIYQPWFDPSLPPQLQPRRGFKPDPRFVPGRVGPRIDPRTDPRDIDPGDLYGPRMPRPRPRRRVKPRLRPRLPPWWDPIPRPVVPVPQPVVDPVPWPDTTPGPGVSPVPGPAPGNGPAPQPAPQTPPGWEVVVSPQPGVRPILRPGPPPSAPVTPPPGPRGRETKLGANRAGIGWLLWLFNFTTETNDFLTALGKALPCAIQRKLPRDANIPKTMQVLYDHWDEIDWVAAMNELFLNQVEDYAIGKTRAVMSKGFGSGESWENYLKQLQIDKATGFGESSGRAVNDLLDEVADKMGLHRVKCGRR